MSKDLNICMVIGHLGRDPETRYTESGQAVTNMSVASSRQWNDSKTGEPREKTEWFRCVSWGPLAEVQAKYLQKGSRVHLSGRMETRSWEDQATGQTRYMCELIVQEMIMLDSRRGNQSVDAEGDEDQVEQAEQEAAPAPKRAAAPAVVTTPVPPARTGKTYTQRPTQPAAAQPQRAQATNGRRAPVAAVVDEEDLPF